MATGTESWPEESPVCVIRPAAGASLLDLGELWRYRELAFFLVWKDFTLRYKQTALGALWVVLQPLFTMAVFSLVFGRLARLPSDGLPYPIFSYVGLLPWSFFSSGLIECSSSLINNAPLLRKAYFPRLLIPLCVVLVRLADLIAAALILLGMMLYYGIPLRVQALWLPAFAGIAVASAVGSGLWLSAVNVKFRDVRYMVPFIVQLWMFATPIVYPASLVPERWRAWLGLNPLAGVVEGFRWALLGGTAFPGGMLAASAASAAVLLLGGLLYFRRHEIEFSDVL